MLVADTLTADLTFYANALVPTGWEAMQSLRGVAEGDMTRYALERREPLALELEAFAALLRGAAGDEVAAPVVTLEEGLETVAVAEAVLASAASGETVALEHVA
jgi:predicted dehydrogenase